MAANNSISLVNLDFDTLKTQLKTYLKGQSQFADYDFDGSNMSVLLDILTYNTHLNAFYLNMVASEMFLDSAQLRNSVISIAKSLNYTPRSTKSSRAILNLRFAQSGLSSFSIPAGTRFSGKNSRGTYQFVTDESLILYPTNNFFTANNVTVYEGSLTSDVFVTNYAIENQRFILSNETIDTDSIQVVVSEDNGQTNTVFTKSTTLYDITANSTIYFVQATEDTKYEVVFGDGVLGRRPKDGSIITCTYRNTSGIDGNESTSFILNDNLGAINGYGSAIIPTITVVSAGFGGGDAESIEDIRYRAPKYYQTQERAVTISDFTSLVLQNFQTIKSIYVYGGDQILGSPIFGTVFISPITFTGNLLSVAEKNEIESFLKARTTVGITPTVVDPDYLYLIVKSTVTYDSNATTLTPTDIQALCKQTIATFNSEQLTDFNTELKLSKLETAINETNISIQNNVTEIVLKKIFRTTLLQQTFPLISYKNAIVPGTITSSSFISGGRRYQYADYNPNQNTLSVIVTDNNTTVTNSTNTVYLKDITVPTAVTYAPAGTVNYVTGQIALNGINITSLENTNGIEFFAKPLNQDVSSSDNDVITIDEEAGITVIIRKI